MPLLASNPYIRERIGVTGLDKTGKSTGIFATALQSFITHYGAAQATGNWAILEQQPIFWLIDLDRQAARYLFSSHYAQYRLLRQQVIPAPTPQQAALFNPHGNIVLFECFNHEQISQAVETIMASARPDDWAVVDMIHYAWENVRDWYTRETRNKSLAQFEMEAQKNALLAKAAKKKQGAKLDFNDWGAIKSGYNDVIRRLLMQGPCHFYTTFIAEPLGEDESPKITQHWGAVGVKPKGVEANLMSQLRTVLVMSRHTFPGHPPHYTIQTQTESGRPMLPPTLINELPGQGDFTQVYLQQIAGWQV